MLRHLLVAAVFALAVPAAAGAAPPTAGATHPAVSAHATSVAGMAKAARIEACIDASRSFFDALAKADYKAATSNFNAQLRTQLGADKLAADWRITTAQLGKLESRGTPLNMMYQGYAVVTTPLHFQRGNLNARLACDASGKFAGFHLLPVPPLSSPALK